jgi:hypothetical protein
MPETSVARLQTAVAERVAHLAKYIRYPKPALGTTKVSCSALGDLKVYRAPQVCFREHAVIKGWPTGADPKDLWKQRAALLAKAASPVTLLD